MRTPRHATTAASRWARLRQSFAAKPLGWRLTVPIAFACAGLLGATSFVNAQGTDLRGGRYTDLTGIVSEQRAKVESLRQQTAALQAQVEQLSANLAAPLNNRLYAKLEQLELPAGLRALAGPGLVVALNDAPHDETLTGGIDPNLLVVHQQDIQAVVNALWAGGADGISLAGQRVIATTGIKCVGNTVVLQGVPYSPPYRIVAIGDSKRLYDALLASPEVRNYRDYVRPPYNLGWSLRASQRLVVPAYTAPVTLAYAKPTGP
ncbi:MAG: DUF881 domain-containing protein [Nocardioidaceae bacterium]